MRRDFDEFDAEQRQDFLLQLSCLVGCMPYDIVDVIFRRSCVIFEGTLPAPFADRLQDLFRQWKACRNTGAQLSEYPEAEELELFRRWMEAYRVKSISDGHDEQYRVQIIRTRPRAIVFVHGWSGDSDSFGKMPEFLRDRLGCPTELYEYPSGLFSQAPSLRHVALNLDAWIRNKGIADMIGIVAHSMGGLVVRKMIYLQMVLANERRLDTYVKQITFIASPYSGSALAHIAQDFSIQLEELRAGGSFVEELNRGWVAWIQNHGSHCKVRSIFGTRDSIVTAENAQGIDPEAVPILGATHTSIIKPKTADDMVVQTIERFLREAGF